MDIVSYLLQEKTKDPMATNKSYRSLPKRTKEVPREEVVAEHATRFEANLEHLLHAVDEPELATQQTGDAAPLRQHIELSNTDTHNAITQFAAEMKLQARHVASLDEKIISLPYLFFRLVEVLD